MDNASRYWMLPAPEPPGFDDFRQLARQAHALSVVFSLHRAAVRHSGLPHVAFHPAGFSVAIRDRMALKDLVSDKERYQTP